MEDVTAIGKQVEFIKNDLMVVLGTANRLKIGNNDSQNFQNLTQKLLTVIEEVEQKIYKSRYFKQLKVNMKKNLNVVNMIHPGVKRIGPQQQ